MSSQSLVCLDVGEKRIGVAVADVGIRIAVPLLTITVDGDELRTIAEIVERESAKTIVVGYPRNQQGESTAQTAYVERFSGQLTDIAEVVFQDESLTSVIAEDRLKQSGKPYQKADIDAQAAAIILQDYLETYYG
ncbi:Holliday junction resolvase RuvX [Candidatus Saccharibacteria bacterium]|nr:Holliday junction resolvase RuvX [Candidatus Saccharibacteria bacterium]MBJ58177.1 Holliday junction resolvase RuvX [Candidatus Saccharibacteria bacterium]MBQ69707.1 Holliday junction resolvase RuvX [Candidatus Saccharibacteria bacterium]|tara:strand:+ start:391 stop:795 length:405 start_codon:yes stop_codon:yes gene_type:complete